MFDHPDVPFVALEGIDGCGKDTQGELLAARMRELGADPLIVRFPDRRTPFGRFIDSYLKGRWRAQWVDAAPPVQADMLNGYIFQALQSSNRLELAADIHAALTVGRPVISIRNWPSAYAYGASDGLDPQHLIDLHRGIHQPGLFVLLDINPEAGLRRVAARHGSAVEHYERAEKLADVRDQYRTLWALNANVEKPKWLMLDAEHEQDELAKRIFQAIKDRWD